jgi:hypothetical protein
MEAARVATGPARPDGIDELLLPYVPANVRPGGNVKVEAVTNDLYNVSERLRELSPRLAINITTVEGEDGSALERAYTIVEETETGPQVVFRCNVLDGRVVEHVRYLLKVPVAQRYQEAEKLADKLEEERKETEMDTLVEKLGLPMARELLACGFVDGRYSHTDAGRSRRGFGRG